MSSCLLIQSLRAKEQSKTFWKNAATRIDNNLQYYSKSSKVHKGELTYERAIELYI